MGGRGSGGHNRTPTALKKLLGNRGRRPLNEHELQPKPGEPEMPKLSRAAAKEWRRIVPILMALGILTIADGSALAIYCAAFARWQQAERQLSRSPNLASDKSRKLFSIAEKSMKLAKSVLVEFGLTPASRPRLASFCIMPLTPGDDPREDPATKYFFDPPVQ
jgi:P27 family predicted phage terminase small subunit